MQVQPFQADLAGVETLEDLVSFSISVESWHNTAHMGIGTWGSAWRLGRR